MPRTGPSMDWLYLDTEAAMANIMLNLTLPKKSNGGGKRISVS